MSTPFFFDNIPIVLAPVFRINFRVIFSFLPIPTSNALQPSVQTDNLWPFLPSKSFEEIAALIKLRCFLFNPFSELFGALETPSNNGSISCIFTLSISVIFHFIIMPKYRINYLYTKFTL